MADNDTLFRNFKIAVKYVQSFPERFERSSGHLGLIYLTTLHNVNSSKWSRGGGGEGTFKTQLHLKYRADFWQL